MRMVFADGGTTLVEDMPMPEQKAVKRIENGQIIIVRGAQKYNLAGQKIGTTRESQHASDSRICTSVFGHTTGGPWGGPKFTWLCECGRVPL